MSPRDCAPILQLLYVSLFTFLTLTERFITSTEILLLLKHETPIRAARDLAEISIYHQLRACIQYCRYIKWSSLFVADKVSLQQIFSHFMSSTSQWFIYTMGILRVYYSLTPSLSWSTHIATTLRVLLKNFFNNTIFFQSFSLLFEM